MFSAASGRKERDSVQPTSSSASSTRTEPEGNRRVARVVSIIARSFTGPLARFEKSKVKSFREAASSQPDSLAQSSDSEANCRSEALVDLNHSLSARAERKQTSRQCDFIQTQENPLAKIEQVL